MSGLKHGDNYFDSITSISEASADGGAARLRPMATPNIPPTTSKLCKGLSSSMSNVSAASFVAITPKTRPTACSVEQFVGVNVVAGGVDVIKGGSQNVQLVKVSKSAPLI